MKRMTIYLPILLAFLWAQDLSAKGIEFKHGDVLIFIGDSITHQCLYTQYVEDFLITRFPRRQILFVNAGIRGNKAGDVLNRFDLDIAPHQATYATILLAMNDGAYQKHDPGRFAIYQRDMTALVAKLRAAGVQPIIMTPTLFDHAQYARRLKEDNFRFKRLNTDPDYNKTLAIYGDWAKGLLTPKETSIDLWTALNTATTAMRQKQPDFTFAPDAIHPDAGGHLIMAWTMAKQIKAGRSQIADISIDAAKGSSRATSGKLEAVKVTDGGVSFRFQPVCLPWVLPYSEDPGPKPWLYPEDPRSTWAREQIGPKINREFIQITGLPEGKYDLWIDRLKVMANLTAAELAAGIDLSDNPHAPNFKQALAIATLNRTRNHDVIRSLRDLMARLAKVRSKDPQAFKRQQQTFSDKRAALLKQQQTMLEKAYRHAQPVSRQYELRAASP